MKQINEKTIRLRYIRLLEKFATKAVTLLKYDNFSFELYKKAVLRGYESLQKAQSVPLYSEYPARLKSYAQLILDTLDSHDKEENETDEESFEEKRQILLKEYNLLQKEKNKNSYKKDKHKHKKFNDGY